jgi:hypothetical protein
MGALEWALIEYPAEVHAVHGSVRAGKFVSDTPHDLSPECVCRPTVVWDSDAAPRPLYEHHEPKRALA